MILRYIYATPNSLIFRAIIVCIILLLIIIWGLYDYAGQINILDRKFVAKSMHLTRTNSKNGTLFLKNLTSVSITSNLLTQSLLKNHD